MCPQTGGKFSPHIEDAKVSIRICGQLTPARGVASTSSRLVVAIASASPRAMQGTWLPGGEINSISAKLGRPLLLSPEPGEQTALRLRGAGLRTA